MHIVNQCPQLRFHPSPSSSARSPAMATSSHYGVNTEQPEPELVAQPEEQFPKNRLQEFTHKLKLPLPLYETVSIGSNQTIRFKSTVIVNGNKFESPNTFSNRKAAEKYIAEFALKHLASKKVAEEVSQDVSLSPEEIDSYKFILNESGLVTGCYKSILNEVATKNRMGNPTYITKMCERLTRVFNCSLVFNGASYHGSSSKNKKEAEQMAARAVIMSLLDIPKMGKVVGDIINSKIKPCGALQNITVPNCTAALPINMPHVPSNLPTKVSGGPMTVYTHPTLVSNTTASVVPGAKVSPPIHSFSVQNPDNSLQATNLMESADTDAPPRLPIEFVHPLLLVVGDTDVSTSKKRRKNKKKGNKRLCTDDTVLPVANLAFNQAPPWSTAQ